MRLVMLKNAAEFKRVRGGARFSCGAFAIEAKARPAADGEPQAASRFGLIATKKLGGAVERNRIRRRIKEALRATAGELARPGFDYVILARRPAYEVAFSDLVQAFRSAFANLERQAQRGGSGGRRTKSRDAASPPDDQSKRRHASEQ
ncbi:MAG: ribonuclease P protein component [Hyphomicrobiaceae bacterium]